MAQREEGWPLGLQPLNSRIGLAARNHDLSASVSFSTLLTTSPSFSSLSSSDLDTQSTGSFFHDKSITLGSLIGISSFIEQSRRSSRRRTTEASRDQKNSFKSSRHWLFSLCSKLSTDAVDPKSNNAAQSLGHFLQVERTATTNIYRPRNHTPAPAIAAAAYGPPGDFTPAMLTSEPNPLFVGNRIAPHSNASFRPGDGMKSDRQLLEHGNGYGVPLLLSCFCGQLVK